MIVALVFPASLTHLFTIHTCVSGILSYLQGCCKWRRKKVGQILTLDGEDPAEVAAGSEGPVVCRRKRASAVLRPSVLLLSGPLSNKMHPQNNTLALFSSRHVRKSHQHSRVARWPPGGSLTTFTSVLVFSTSL